MLENVKRVHFIGIAGAGMRAVANVLVQKGYNVSGSDIRDSEVTKRFRAVDVPIFIGHDSKNIEGADVVVISSAIPADNVELMAAKQQHIPVLHRSDVLLSIMNWGKGIAVAGAHGKTTTTSMIGQVFEEAAMDPTIIIGGEVDYLHSNSKLGKGEYVIAEADESDGSFLKLNPYIAIVTNIENDHMDHYGSMENILKAFQVFLQKLDPLIGKAILCFDNENIRNIAPHIGRNYISYGISTDADYNAKNIHYVKGLLNYEVEHNEKNLGMIRLQIPGRHNVLNSMAVVAVAMECGIPFAEISSALYHFHGAKRRFQTKGRQNDVWVVDDYAHHPTEINATLKAAKELESHRVICVFQPHRYTRTQLLQTEFSECFRYADTLVLTDVYSAGEKPIEGVSGELIAKSVKKSTGKDSYYIPNKADLPDFLATFVKPFDLVITMGAGDVYLAGEKLLDLLKEKK